MIVVSYCKLGLACTYKGGTNEEHPDSAFLKELFRKGLVIPVCPEALGGLTTPRDPSEIRGGDGFAVLEGRAKVISSKGIDVTANFVAGAGMCAGIAEKFGAKAAVLVEYSPSCGVNFVYDGTFTRKPVSGPGVFAAALRKRMERGFKIFDFIDESGFHKISDLL